MFLYFDAEVQKVETYEAGQPVHLNPVGGGGTEFGPCFDWLDEHGIQPQPIHAPAAELTANRDLRYIHWRYFSGRDDTIAVFAFRNRQLKSDILVTVNQRPRGYRGQIRCLHVLDIYPATTPEVDASIVAALVDRYRNAVDAIVLRGLDQARQEIFVRSGFIRRQFEAPNGWFLDRSGFLPTRNFYLVPADGDWLI